MMSEKQVFNEPVELQEWYDVGADIRINIRTQFSKMVRQYEEELTRTKQELQNRDERISHLIEQSVKEGNSLRQVLEDCDALIKQLEEAEKVIEFYASEDTWINKEIINGSLFAWEKRHPGHDVSTIPYSIGESNGNFHCLGKKAREYLAKKGKT